MRRGHEKQLVKAAIVTVAGLSTRFSESVGRDVLKSVYHEDDPSETLLARLLGQVAPFVDKVVVVGGHRFDDLVAYVSNYIDGSISSKVDLVLNKRYADLGSGWSLTLGIDALEPEAPESILFVEGDLFLDNDALSSLVRNAGDAITVSPDPVEASKSVALYFDAAGTPHYVYDVSHGLLSIPEPFKSVRSSGQVWRFGDLDRLMGVSSRFVEGGGNGTNLEIVGPYFEESDASTLEIVPFVMWVNCNTVQDWIRAFYG